MRVAVVVAAAAAMLTVSGAAISRRVMAVVALTPALLASPPAWAFVLAGALLALAVTQPQRSRSEGSPLERLQRRLEWHRRRDEQAEIVWIHAPEMSQEQTRATLKALRVTDAAAQAPGDGAGELVAMLDSLNLDRVGFERRIREAAGAVPMGIGWAAFPDDGVTLDTLFQQARRDALAQLDELGVDVPAQPFGLAGRLGPKPAQRVPVQSSSQG